MQNKDKARIIEASARLHLEKETEHFLSDLHGEYEAFECARRFVSGAVRRKIDALFGSEVDGGEMAAVIAFPKEKLRRMRDELGEGEYPEWLTALTERLIRLCAYVAEKQTRDTVDATLDAHAGVYADLLGELIFSHGARRKREYVGRIYSGFRRMGLEEELVVMLCSVIRALTAGRLHVIGDIYDRGPRPDLIVDAIAQEESVDLVWGNHDLLWIAASLGSEAAIFTAIANSLYYGNTELLEVGYGISLEPLATLAQELYPEIDTEIYYPKSHRHKSTYTPEIIAKMHKTAIVIREKLTADVIKRRPEFGMDDRLLLGNISGKQIFIQNTTYELRDGYFPTVSCATPYVLTSDEQWAVEIYRAEFLSCERLTQHAELLRECGALYRVYNENLLLHGCIPLTDSGEFMPLAAGDGRRGRALLDYLDDHVRCAVRGERCYDVDLSWFLWCGKNSPLTGRERMASLERLLVSDPKAHAEPRNAYYRAWDDPRLVDMILREFGLTGTRSHVINGHIPVKRGESPIKAHGRLIVIDGGFSSAYYPKTGIGGYTLIYNSEGMRLVTHRPFISKENILKNNGDVISETVIFEKRRDKIRVRETDAGAKIREWLTEEMGK